MIISMTGFANSTLSIPYQGSQLIVSITLKALNGRYFEATCKIPYALVELEPHCLKILKDKLYRGTVYCTIHIQTNTLIKGPVTPAYSTIQGYVDACVKIQQHTGLSGELTLAQLMTLPNVFEITEQQLPEEIIEQLIHEIKRLADKVHEARAKEGHDLYLDLMQRTENMARSIIVIEERSHEVIQQKKQSITQQITDLPAHISPEMKDQYFLTLQGQLDKLSIHEEIVRFKSHLANFKRIINATSIEKGKELDFIVQEMLREINTMNAKCSDSSISETAIAIKVELEKAREQVQNSI